MLRTRIIPTLLLKDELLVKTIKFKKPNYIGDPINAIKVFNDKEVDEIILLDISSNRFKNGPSYKLLGDIVTEAFMPMGYGGGIISIEQISKLFKIGFEKVILNSVLFENFELLEKASKIYGNQSIVVSIDIKKDVFGRYRIFSHNGRRLQKVTLNDFLIQCQEAGAGEVYINSIDRDGTFKGYDLQLIKNICGILEIPLIASGGASSINDFVKAVKIGGASAVSAGSFFVYKGVHRAVLISYPDYGELEKKLNYDV